MPHWPISSKILRCWEKRISNIETHGRTLLFSQSDQTGRVSSNPYIPKFSYDFLYFRPTPILAYIFPKTPINGKWKKSFGLGLENRVRSVASTVLDGFFSYLVQMITSIRCVAWDDIWPWPISSRLFYLDFENRVRSVAFSVLDRLFLYLPQIITTLPLEGVSCVKITHNKILKFQFFANFSSFSVFTMTKNLQFCLHSFHIWHKSSLASEGVSHVMTFDLDLYFEGHSVLTLKIVSAL